MTLGRGACGVCLFLFCITFAFFAHAQTSPKPIGYFCSGTTTSIVEGQYYLPQADPCTYLSTSFDSGNRHGTLFRGTVGSSTKIGGHESPSATMIEFGDVNDLALANIQPGEDMFVAIFRFAQGFHRTQFINFFQTGSNPPIGFDYGFLRFKYGTPPPPPSLSFNALPLEIEAGATSTLSWSAANATSCAASNGWSGLRLLSGTEIVALEATTTYELVCTGPGGAASSSVTIAVHPVASAVPDPVIIIPGILGSEKNSDGEWVIDPILHTYDDLIATLDVNHYTPGVDLFPFPYNWRKSNVETAVLLKQKIDEVKAICSCDKVDLVAHSMGGLVARQYIQSSEYNQDVDQLIFLGTPHLGAPKAYLMWEGGEVGPNDITKPLDSIVDELTETILSHEAFEKRYPSLFAYLRTEPIEAVRQLLPTNDYIFDSGVLRLYPQNYPANSFLEELNANTNSLLTSGVEIHNIVGSVSEQRTITGINVIDPTPYLPIWLHGYPEGFYNLIGEHGLVRGDGDNTVPLPSASLIGENLTSVTSVHQALPEEAQGNVYQILAGEVAATLVDSWNIPNAKIVLFKIFSPADLLVEDPDGNKIGKENGQIVNQISGAFYTGFTTDTEYITIINPLDGEYKVITEGTANGSYTVETNYISDATSTKAAFTGNTSPGLLTELVVPVDNQNPEELEVQPTDTDPPVITITQPEAKDYLRSVQLPIDVSAQDASGVFVLETKQGTTTIANTGTIDLFFQKLGPKTLTASSTDNVGNATTSARAFRVIATASSTISDIDRAYALGWLTATSYQTISKKFKAAIKFSRVVETWADGRPKGTKIQAAVDKILMAAMLIELQKHRGKGLSEQGYQLLREDIVWLINN
ncbi:MAG: hypothetical protein WA021_03085 [Minisyncoccia bacterium]